MMENDAREVKVADPQWTAITDWEIADWEIANWENEGGAIMSVTGKGARSLPDMNIPPKRPSKPADKGH